jgi:hypothetical protein
VKDNGSNLVGGAIVTFDSNSVVIGQILDNSPSDGDPAAGKFQLPIPYETNYRICFTTAPQGYVLYPGQQTCFSGAIKMGMGVVDWGTFTVAPNLSASWKVTEVPPANHWNANPACKQLTVALGVPVDLGLFVNYEKQVSKP